MNLYLQKESKWKNANKKSIGLCNRDKEGIHTKKREGVFIVKRVERRDMQVHQKTIEEWVYLALKVSPNGTYVFCRKEEW